MAEWTKDESGMILLRPLAGYETAVVAETACALRIEHGSGHAEKPGLEAVQLVLTSAQARALAGALLRMADRAERLPPPGTPRN
ncbi:chemotaxis protein [Rhodoligotrophos ferricapiens]|uniref:chemotaxis protein n=1 Tax=Rhodoligotrophos ferricapiens TaxID=3069264 RepID=UPI00315CEB6A